MKGERSKIILLIDTLDSKKITIGLSIGGQKFINTRKITSNRKQIVLIMIDKIFKKYLVKLKDLSAVEVNVGSGSFTGLRVGLAIANALSYGLKIPVFKKSFNSGILK